MGTGTFRINVVNYTKTGGHGVPPLQISGDRRARGPALTDFGRRAGTGSHPYRFREMGGHGVPPLQISGDRRARGPAPTDFGRRAGTGSHLYRRRILRLFLTNEIHRRRQNMRMRMQHQQHIQQH